MHKTGYSVVCVGKSPTGESRAEIRAREHNHSHHVVHIAEAKGSTDDEFDFVVGSLGACVGEPESGSGNDGVEAALDFSAQFPKRRNAIPCALYELQVSDEVYDAAKQEVQQMMMDRASYRFSVLGLILCRLNIPYHRKRHFFSQFVSEILMRSRALPLPKDTALMRPNDYTAIPELFCRFRGRLNELLREQICLAA